MLLKGLKRLYHLKLLGNLHDPPAKYSEVEYDFYIYYRLLFSQSIKRKTSSFLVFFTQLCYKLEKKTYYYCCYTLNFSFLYFSFGVPFMGCVVYLTPGSQSICIYYYFFKVSSCMTSSFQ